MLELLKKEIETLEQQRHLAWHSWTEKNQHYEGPGVKSKNGKDELIKNVLAKYEERGGIWREKITGRRTDIQAAIIHELQVRTPQPLIKNRDIFSSYVSAFKPRDGVTLNKHAVEMAKLVKTQLERSNYIFQTPEIEKKVIDSIAQNFLAVDSEDGTIKYHKVNGEGVISPSTWTLEELGQNFGFSRLIDNERTDLSQKIYESNLREKAEKIIGRRLITPKGSEDISVRDMMNQLKKLDAPKANKKLSVDKNFILDEFRKQVTIESGISNPSQNEKRMFERNAEFRLNELNSVSSLAPSFHEIETPSPQTWEL